MFLNFYLIYLECICMHILNFIPGSVSNYDVGSNGFLNIAVHVAYTMKCNKLPNFFQELKGGKSYEKVWIADDFCSLPCLPTLRGIR